MKTLLYSIFFISILFNIESAFSQNEHPALNFLIKTGNFDDFYDSDNSYEAKGSYAKDSAYPSGYKKVDPSNAYLNLFYEIPVADRVTVSPSIGVDIAFDWFLLGARADYYFHSHIPNLPEQLNLWGGTDAGFILGQDGDNFMINGHAGGEWRFHENWGALVEFGYGSTKGSIGGGIGYHF